MSASPKKQRPRAVKVNDDTVAWLKSNFEMKAGCTVPRGLVYRAYVAHMETMLSEPCNAAGFGKVIRSVFKSVTSRRLGSRGSSRYHYDGLRIKPSSAVAMSRLAEDDEEDQLYVELMRLFCFKIESSPCLKALLLIHVSPPPPPPRSHPTARTRTAMARARRPQSAAPAPDPSPSLHRRLPPARGRRRPTPCACWPTPWTKS